MSDTKYGKIALINDVVSATGLTRKQVDKVGNATLATIQQKVQKGQAVTLVGFGSFKVSQRQARSGINPLPLDNHYHIFGARDRWQGGLR
jgi:nucleoid DNA-binding protein